MTVLCVRVWLYKSYFRKGVELDKVIVSRRSSQFSGGSLRTTTIRSGSPHSRNDSRNSPASNPSRDEIGEDAVEHAPDAKTPKVLWASTPTPKASRSTYSFALPPEGPQGVPQGVPQGPTLAARELNAKAAAFIPEDESALQALQTMENISQVLQAFESSEIHAEAQAVMMAESVLGLDLEPKQRSVAQVSHRTVGGVTEDSDQGTAEPTRPTLEKLPSKGSAFHAQGQCRPCAWMWKPRGCQNADTCEYCHLCPEGELKHRKKLKIAAIRMGALAALPSQEGTARRGLKLSTLL